MKAPKGAAEARLQLTWDTILIVGLAILGIVLILYRYFFVGIGGVTNLSDGYPWGYWIGIDILAGIALAAGGFVMAGVVHIFGGERFHPLIRPAILTAFLGYLLFIVSLLVDLGRPWNMWQVFFSWNHASPMFEVAWCVIFYTTVLAMEIATVVLERFRLEKLMKLYHQLVPFVVIGLFTIFTYAMTHQSLFWSGLVFAISAMWETLMRTGIMPRDKQMPLLLIMAGIMFSTLHQSSLGTLFLISDKLGPLWHTPILPILFFISAVMVGPAMVTFEALATAWAFKRRPEMHLLVKIGKAMPYLIGLYLVVRIGDMVARGVVLEVLAFNGRAGWWWLEIGLFVFAFVLFTTQEMVNSEKGLFTGALATVFGLIVHRVGVAMVGIDVPEYPPYFPAWSEVMITFGILACGLIAFRLIIHFFPIYEEEHGHEHAAAEIEHPAEESARTFPVGP